jgi:hypothetical protein
MPDTLRLAGALLAPHCHQESDLLDGDLYARLAASETVAGLWGFPAAGIKIGQEALSSPAAGVLAVEGDLAVGGSISLDGTVDGRDVSTDGTKLDGIEAGADVTADHDPKAHAASHKNGGGDEVATATPAANAIPKADADGRLSAGWIPEFFHGICLLAPSGGQTVGFFTDKKITIRQINDVIVGGTNVVWNIKHAATRNSGSPNKLWNSDRTTTSTSGAETSTFDDATIPAGSWVWLSITSVSGEVTQLEVTFHATFD